MSEAIKNVGNLTGLCVWDGSKWVKWDGAGGGIKGVQRGIVTIPNNESTVNVSITAVVLSKSFLSFSAAQSSESYSFPTRGRLTTTTNIEFYHRVAGSVQSYIAWEVIEFL